jgi:FixJ family two-component response regulator
VNPEEPIVFAVDDDASMREALSRLFRSVGMRAQIFASAQDFLMFKRPDAPACLVLDVRLPGLSGLDLQRELAAANLEIPIIFITGHGDIPMSVQAMKAGAVEFLTKPFRDQALLDAIHLAIQRDSANRKRQAEIAEQCARYDSLTQRTRQIRMTRCRPRSECSGFIRSQAHRGGNWRAASNENSARRPRTEVAGPAEGDCL